MQAMHWRAGDLELDLGLHRVRRAGEPVELPGLSFDLLLALIHAAPNFLSNEELMTRVWKGVVVSPETVTQRVKLLRDALGDDPRSPRYVEGLRGRGYRLIPTVMPGERPSAPPASTPDQIPAGPTGLPHRLRRTGGWAVAAATLAFVLLAGFVLLRAPSSRVPVPEDPGQRTAAILPFRVTGELDTNLALANGITDSLLVHLADVPGLQVVASASSAHIDASQLGAQEMGRQLGARYLVDGSAQLSGSSLRVTARLVDSLSGSVLWTEQFDRGRDDFFGMQDVVAAGVKRALQARISNLDPAIPTGERSQNPEAHLAYLRGRALFGRTTIAASLDAEREFARAHELDSTFVPAIVGLHDARMQLASLRKHDMDAALAQNQSLLELAASLEPDSGAVQLARAIWSRDTAEARSVQFEEGLRKDPSNARAMTAYSELLDLVLDRPEEAKQWLDRALRIDPLWPRARFRAAQRNFRFVGSAVEHQNLKLLELDPTYYPSLQRHAKYRWQMHGDTANAVLVIERAIATDPENPWGPHTAVAFYLDAGDPRAAANLTRANAVASASTAAIRAQYVGDWRRAGEAALAPASHVFSRPERWGVPSALRDYGLRTGQAAAMINELSQRYALPLDQSWQLTTDNFREAQLLAHLLLASGQRAQAVRRLDEVIAWIDANGFVGPLYNLRTKAQALALKGEPDAALSLLAESFRARDYTTWWYTLEHDPTWDELRTDSRFVALAAEVRKHVAAQVQRLDALRTEGQIPDRHEGGTLAVESARP